MSIKSFAKPTEFPYEMLAGLGLQNTMECEQVLTWMLTQCIKMGKFAPVMIDRDHPALVKAGLLREVGKREYELTKKAKGYLYVYFGVE